MVFGVGIFVGDRIEVECGVWKGVVGVFGFVEDWNVLGDLVFV